MQYQNNATFVILQPGCALLKEINEINGRLVETVVNICNLDSYPSEVTSGIIVSCSYAPVTLSATFKAHYQSRLIVCPSKLFFFFFTCFQFSVLPLLSYLCPPIFDAVADSAVTLTSSC